MGAAEGGTRARSFRVSCSNKRARSRCIGGAASKKHALGRYLFTSRLENFLAGRLLATANRRA